MNDTKIAVITGAASGIGLGLTKAAADRGHKIYMVDVNAEQLNAVAASVGAMAVPMIADVTSPENMDDLAARIFEAEGRVDYLFNNAGIIRGGVSWEISPAVWRKTIDVNLMGVIHGVCSFVGRMIESNVPGHIINNSSVSGLIPAPLLAPYTASKYGVVGLTEALSLELAVQKSVLSVHLLAPGPVRSRIFAEVHPEGQKDARVDMMGAFTEQAGSDPHEFGRTVFEGIDRGEFWLVTHPEILDEPLKKRTESILTRKAPALEKAVADLFDKA